MKGFGTTMKGPRGKQIFVDGYMTDGDKIVVYYHCAHSAEPDTTLCGKVVLETLLWDYENMFFGARVPSNAVRCPACQKHPDYPLLLMGQLP